MTWNKSEWILAPLLILKGRGNSSTGKEKNSSRKRKNFRHKKNKSNRRDKTTLGSFKKSKGFKNRKLRFRKNCKPKNSKANN
jgi:hypothetical protein